MGVKQKDIDFSAFDSAVKTPLKKESTGVDFSAFDNVVKKKEETGGSDLSNGSQSISPSNSFLRSKQTDQTLQSNFREPTDKTNADLSTVEASLKNLREKYDKVAGAEAPIPLAAQIDVSWREGAIKKSKDDYNLAKKENDNILKANATEIYKPVKDLIDSGGYKNFFDESGNFKIGEASEYLDGKVKEKKGGQYLRDQLVSALKQAGQYQLDEPLREKYRTEEYKKSGIDISKYGQEVLGKATAVQKGNIDLLEADTKEKGGILLNTSIKPEAVKIGTDYSQKVKAIQDQVQSGQIDPQVAQQQFQQAAKDYETGLAALNKHYQEGVRNINIKAQDKFARIDKEMRSIAAGLTDEEILKAIPDDIKKKKADADARVESRIQQSKNEERKAADAALGGVPAFMGGKYVGLLGKSITSGWYSGLANIGQYLGMKGHDNGLTDYLKSKQYDADVTQTGQYEYGNGETLSRLTTSTGSSLGASAPIMLPAVGVTLASGGLGLPEVATSLATGFVSYYGEKAQNTGEVYKQLMDQTGDANKAYEGASRYEEKQKLMMPLYFLEGAGIQNLLKGKGIKQLLIGQAQELAQELPTEYWQNFTQAQETEGYKKGFGSYIKENPATAIDVITSTIGQGSIMSAGGKIIQGINSLIPHPQSQYYTDMVSKHGVEFANENLQKQFNTGVIDEKGLADGRATIARAAQKTNDLAAVGLKGDEAKSFIVQSDIANELANNIKNTTDEGLKIVYEKKLEETKQQMEKAATGSSEYAVFKMPGGADATKVVPVAQIESMRKNGQLDQLIHLSDGVEVKGNEALNKELQERKKQLGNPESAPERMYNEVEQKDAEEKPAEAERPIIDRVKEYGGEGIQRTVAAHEAEGKHTEAIHFLKEQSLDTPNSLKKQLGMRKNLTIDIIAENNPTEINDAILKWEDKLSSEVGKDNSDPKVVKEIDQHISLLEAGLEKAHEKINKTNETKNEVPVSAESQVNSVAETNQNIGTAEKEETPKDLESKGVQVESNLDAKTRFSNGERIFAFHEQDEQPTELRSVEQMDKYAPDQLLAYKQEAVSEKPKIRVSAEEVKKAQPSKEFLTDTQKVLSGKLKKILGSLSGNESILPMASDFNLRHKISLNDLGIKEGDTFKSIVERMADYKGEFEPLLNVIKNLSGIEDIKVRESTKADFDKYGEGFQGGYVRINDNPLAKEEDKGTLVINPKATNQYYALTHEIMHWLTLDNFKISDIADKKKLQTLEDIYNILNKEYKGDKSNFATYGLTNFREFLAEVMINPKLREEVSGIVAKDFENFKVKASLSKDIKSFGQVLRDFINDLIDKIFGKDEIKKALNFDKSLIENAAEIAKEIFLNPSQSKGESASIKGNTDTVVALEDKDRKNVQEFINDEIKNGNSVDDIKAALRDNGLTEDEISSLFQKEKPRIKVVVGEENKEKESDAIDDYDLTKSGVIGEFLSGKTIENIFGESPDGSQSYAVQTLSDMLQDGRNMIGIAQAKWGGDIASYGVPLFEYIQGMSNDAALTNKKAVLLATFLGEIKEEAYRNQDIRGWLSPLENAVEAYYQKYMNLRGKELVAGRLLRLYRDKYLGDIFADRILEQAQIKQKNQIKDALDRKVDDKVAEEKNTITKEEKTESDNAAKKKSKDDAKKQSEKKSLTQKDAQTKAENKLKDLEERLGKRAKETLVEKINEAIKKINCK